MEIAGTFIGPLRLGALALNHRPVLNTKRDDWVCGGREFDVGTSSDLEVSFSTQRTA
jgi:hypothetical protein